MPSGELMPNAPDGTFPVETIKTAINRKDFKKQEYISDVKNYQIKFMTPVYKFYMIEKDRIESLKIRERRNKDKGKLDAGEMFKDLRVWKEYAGELAPAVDILALPETTATIHYGRDRLERVGARDRLVEVMEARRVVGAVRSGERRTRVADDSSREMTDEDLIADEDVVVTISGRGFWKRVGSARDFITHEPVAALAWKPADGQRSQE